VASREVMPEWVFPSLTGTPAEERNVRHVFKRVLEKAGLRHIRIHDLRHRYATLLLQAGAPITYVSAQLGHRDASITLRVYAHYLPSASHREVDRLDTPQPAAPPAPLEAASADQRKRPKLFGLSGEPDFRQLEPDCGLAQAITRFERPPPKRSPGSAAKVWTDALVYAFSPVSCDRPRGGAPPFAKSPQNLISPRRSKPSSRDVSLKPHSERRLMNNVDFSCGDSMTRDRG
jgi:hypothetical protein